MESEKRCENEVEPVNVEELMARVRSAVEEKRRAGIYRDDDWPCDSQFHPGPSAGDDQLALLRSAARVDLEGEPIQSHRPLAGLVVMTLKRFSRYWVRKYTDSLFLRQSTFNAETVSALANLRREVDELRAEVTRLKAQVETLTTDRSGPGDGER